MIKLQIIGFLGKDAVLNNVNGKSVINFTVAHTEKYKDSTGTPKEKTTWVDCAYWTDRTAIAPYLKKGSSVFTEGIPDIRSYTTQDGKNGASLTLRVNNIQLIGGKPTEGGNNFQQVNQITQPANFSNSQPIENSSVNNVVANTNDSFVDDLPF